MSCDDNNPLPFSLVTNVASIYDVPSELKVGTRAVVVSDQHFGLFQGLKCLPVFEKKLSALLQSKNANCLFLLGDTVDWRAGTQHTMIFEAVFNFLETLNIPVFVLGGNHDKERLLDFNHGASSKTSKVKVVEETFIRIHHPNSDDSDAEDEISTGILMGHDLGNNFMVDPPDAPIYVKWMRDVFSRYFAKGEMMLLGHTHQNIAFPKLNSYTIAQFSPESNRYYYAYIEDVGKGYTVDFKKFDI